MSKSDLLKELRARTQAGMKDCHDALRETNDDLEKAVDLIKTKGKNIVSGRESKVASEGLVVASYVGLNPKAMTMVEVNCQTDFVARSPEFKQFANAALALFNYSVSCDEPFDLNSHDAQSMRADVVSTTKENCVIRRWWLEEVMPDTCRVFSYIHNGGKLGVIVSLQAPSIHAASSPEFFALGTDLAMQVAAMNPIAVEVDRLSPDSVERQKSIFEAQLTELKKPQASWGKILDGKFNKWYTDVCLLEQESVTVPKKLVKQVINEVGEKLGGEIKVINFHRCQVGEGIEQVKESLADEVAKLMS